MRTGRTPVKISILVALGCAHGTEQRNGFDVPKADSRDADIQAIREKFDTQIHYLGSSSLPIGDAEVYRFDPSGGVLVYLPVAETASFSFATGRRFVTADGRPMTAIERSVATEQWRLHLDDPRRRALHARGAIVRNQRTHTELHELVSVPLVDSDSDLEAFLALLEDEFTPDPSLLLERVIRRHEEDDPKRDAETEEVPAETLVVGREALSGSSRARDADAVVLLGRVGRKAALTIGQRWLGAARKASAPSADSAKQAPEPETNALEAGPSASSFLVRFPIPHPSLRTLAEMATRWLGRMLERRQTSLPAAPARGEPRVREIQFRYGAAPKTLDLVVDFPEALTSSAASTRLAELLRAQTRARISPNERRELAAFAETERQASIEGPMPLALTLVAAALEGELELVARPIVAPRPGALTTWLDSVLDQKAGAWMPLTSHPEGPS